MKIRIIFSFLFASLSSVAWSQQMTRGEVFDYRVGDEFHFRDTTVLLSEFTGKFKEIVRSRNIVGDTIIHQIEVITDDTSFMRYSFLLSSELNEPVVDSSMFHIVSYRKGEYYYPKGLVYENYKYVLADSVNGVMTFEDEFARGLGPLYHRTVSDEGTYSYGVVYYKGFRGEWGDPLVTEYEVMPNGYQIIIDPDTFSRETIVSFNGTRNVDFIHLQMRNENGMETMDTDIIPGAPHRIVPHESLKPGKYFLVFSFYDFVYIRPIYYDPK